jgi:uncharacterized membrane protein
MAGQSLSQPPAYPAPKPRIEIVMKKGGAFLLNSWALIMTIFFSLIVLAAVSTPLLTYFGLDALAKPIFFAFHLICSQIPSHSFYLAGHQLGLDAHCLAIYGALFAGSLAFVLSKKRLPGLPWWAFVLMTLPLAYDGLTQLFGLRQSTWEIRLLTGALFGLGAAWFAFPWLQKTLTEMLSTPAHPTSSGSRGA